MNQQVHLLPVLRHLFAEMPVDSFLNPTVIRLI
jgi:hypothetical protein